MDSGLIVMAFLMLISLGMTAAMLYALYDLLTSGSMDSMRKLVWVIVIVFVPFGFLLYFLIE